ncbi:MAG: hypothetical protein SFU56_19495 [Capsulimonadales bacterium]|nr:hypothetical protein [Capsulimonadales bacterium]
MTFKFPENKDDLLRSYQWVITFADRRCFDSTYGANLLIANPPPPGSLIIDIYNDSENGIKKFATVWHPDFAVWQPGAPYWDLQMTIGGSIPDPFIVELRAAWEEKQRLMGEAAGKTWQP